MMGNSSGSEASGSNNAGGNNAVYGRSGGGDPPGHPSRRTVSRPRLITNWNDINHPAMVGISTTNGLLAMGRDERNVFPEELMELLLSHVDLNDLNSVAQVRELI